VQQCRKSLIQQGNESGALRNNVMVVAVKSFFFDLHLPQCLIFSHPFFCDELKETTTNGIEFWILYFQLIKPN